MQTIRKQILFPALCAILLIAACNKNDTTTPGVDEPPVTNNQLKGSWDQVMSVEVNYENDVENDRDTSIYTPGNVVYVFHNDSLDLYVEGDLEESLTYSIVGNELLMRSGSSGYFFGLKWYHKDQIGLIQDETRVNSSGVKRRSVNESFFVRKP